MRHTTTTASPDFTDALRRLRRRAGQKLARAREAAGLTQRRLARRLGLQAWSLIASIEAGTRATPPDLARQFAEALDAPGIEDALLRVRQPIGDDVLVLLLRSPKLLARLEERARKSRSKR